VQPFGIAIEGSAGNVYVADTQNDRIEEFTANGGFIRAFGGPGELSKPIDVAVDRGPPYNVYVTDTNNHQIRKYTPEGRLLQTFGSIGTQPGQLTLPRALAIEPDGNLLVGQAGRITRFSPTGSFLAAWGSVGSGDGQFRYLSDLTVDGAGNVYTIDRDLSRVQKFDPSGTYLSQWGSRGSGDGQLLSPGAITAAATNVYVSDSGNARLQKFTLAGQFLTAVGARGQGPGQFVAPAGLEASPVAPGNLYVVEFTGCCSRVQVFRLAAGPPPVPPPVAGRSVNVAPVSGTVRVRLRGTSTFVALTAGSQIPAGSEIDVTAGRIRLTSAAKAGKTQTADFYAGRFVVTTAKTLPTTLQLSAPLACPKRATSGSRTAQLKKRRLWGSGKGGFRTRARYAAATVRGTVWLTEDTCTTTTVRVVSGKVAVSDFIRRKTVVVTAGKTYVARRR
jgi:hypothetical protein